jgi:protein-S-isoprenylcysteine O-methyltransferase Ste14
MKSISQALRKSTFLYVGLFIASIITVIKTVGLPIADFLLRFWKDCGLFLIITHVLYVVVFAILQGRIDKLNQHPPANVSRQESEQQQKKADTWMRWIAGPIWMGSLLALIGWVFYMVSHTVSYGVAVILTLFLLYVHLIGASMNTLSQNYLHYLRKRTAKTVDEVLASGQAPILYLRSFKDDEIAGKRDVTVLTEEEELTKAFERIGPMIAIGRPGETLPDTGAARAYFRDDEWQAAVHHYFDISRLVVLRAGLSQGLLWEIQNSIQLLDPAKLILLIPFLKNDYDQFRERVQPLFPKPLPDHPGHEVHLAIGGLSRQTENKIYGSLFGLIHFDADWTAHFEKIYADDLPYLHQMTDQMNYMMLHYALRPVYARLGLAWTNPENALADFLKGKKA